MMKNPPRILVIGSINMDLVLRVSSIPAAGETLLGETYQNSTGGKGANQATAAALLGAHVTYAGRIGDDANGQKLLQALQASGVDTAHVKIDPETPTGLAVVFVESDGSNRILVFGGSNMRLSKEDVVPLIEQGRYDALVIQLEIPQETVVEACRAAMKRKMTVVVDAGPAQCFPLDQITGVTVLSPNETETAALCGINPDTEARALDAAKLLMEQSKAQYIIIKRGAHGAYVYGGGINKNFETPRVKTVDTTAAGDAFTAALAVRMAGQDDMDAAVRYAAFAGAYTVTKPGAQSALPTEADLDAFIRAYAGK